MSKIIAVGLFLMVFGNGLNSQSLKNQFVLKGRMEGKNEGWLYLNYSGINETAIRDSVALINGSFSFKGRINNPILAYLWLKEKKRSEFNSTNIFLEPTKMTIKLKYNDFRNAIVSGSKSHNEYAALERTKIPIEAKYKKQLDSLRSETNHEKRAEIRERLAPCFSERMQMDYRFFERHPQSFVTAYMLRFHVAYLSIDSLQLFYGRLGEKLQQTPEGKFLAKEIQDIIGGTPGSPAKYFSATDINGNKLSLSDFKGKYVLLDFWASWCVPCRKGNPHLKELYTQYKDKGIEFIGISDDDHNPDAWRKAVEKNGLPWRHVLRGLDIDKKGKKIQNENEISDRFGIQTLPTKILIDPAGMIIGRYGEDEQGLNEMLKKIFDK